MIQCSLLFSFKEETIIVQSTFKRRICTQSPHDFSKENAVQLYSVSTDLEEEIITRRFKRRICTRDFHMIFQKNAVQLYSVSTEYTKAIVMFYFRGEQYELCIVK